MRHSTDNLNTTRSGSYPARHKRGFILLVLVMVLAVLSLLAVEFQTESALQVRISSHRQDVIQCDYALESGLAAAGKLIQEYHDEMLDKIRNPQAHLTPPAVTAEADAESLEEVMAELEELTGAAGDDPNATAGDPNAADALADPNATLGQAPEEWKGHLLRQVSIEVGKAQVEIFIYGENYKLPLIWAMHSPFTRSGGGRDTSLTMVKELLTNLDADSGKVSGMIKYLNYLIGDMKTPYYPTMTKLDGRWVKTGASITNEEIDLLTVKNHMLFAAIGSQLYKDVNNERYPEIKEALTLPSNNLISDYLGLWGGIRININTAPAEVLAAGFKDVGLTMELAQKIVATRNEKGLYRSPILIREIPGLEEIYTAIYPMADVIDHVYTVKIAARSGEVTKTKSACFYRNGKKLEILAVF